MDCYICKSRYVNQINDLIKENKTDDEISSLMCTEDFKVSGNAVNSHKMNCLISEETSSVIQCFACNHRFVNQINSSLINGESPVEIAESMTERGFDITSDSIMFHKNNCLKKIELEDSYKKKKESLVPIDPLKSFESTEHNNVMESLMKTQNISQNFLQRIFRNQLKIVANMQEEFMNGSGIFPSDEIKSLQIIYGLIKDFTPHEKMFCMYCQNNKI